MYCHMTTRTTLLIFCLAIMLTCSSAESSRLFSDFLINLKLLKALKTQLSTDEYYRSPLPNPTVWYISFGIY